MNIPGNSASPPSSLSTQLPSSAEPGPDSWTMSCAKSILWVSFLLTLVLEAFFSIAVIVDYYMREQYLPFGLTMACLVLPTIIVACVSLVWYYDQDKYFRSLQLAHPDDRNLKRYKKFLTFWSVVCHILLCGQVYRYCQLLYHTISSKRAVSLTSLWKDAALLRFLHGFLMSAPQITVQFYVLLKYMALRTEADTEVEETLSPLTCSSLVASALSLLVTIFSYTSSDRLHCDSRRVVLMGHVTCYLWHVCMTAARVCALVTFAIGFGPYIVVVVGIHWLASVLWMAYERTDFCGDITVRPQKRRTGLEVIFIMIISFVFLFIFFNVKNGPTLGRIVVYHVVTCAETVIIVAVYYGIYSYATLSPWLFCCSIGLYLLGVFFLGLFFGVWHPNRTRSYLYVGIPKNCFSFSFCCSSEDKGSELPDGMGNVDLPLNVISNSSSTATSYSVAQETANAGLRCGTIPGMLGATGMTSAAATGQRQGSNPLAFMPNRVISSTPNPSVARSSAVFSDTVMMAPSTVPVTRTDVVLSSDAFSFNQPRCRESGETFSRPVSRLSTANMFETRGSVSQPVMTPSTLSGANSPENGALPSHLEPPSSSVQRSQSDRVVRLSRARELPHSQFTNGTSSHHDSMAVPSSRPPRTDPMSRRSGWYISDMPPVPSNTVKRHSGSYARTQPTNMAGARAMTQHRSCSSMNPQRRSGCFDVLSADIGYPGQLMGGDPSIHADSSFPQVQVNVTEVEPNGVLPCQRVSRYSGKMLTLGRVASSGEYDHIPRIVNGAGHCDHHWGDSSYYHPQGYVSTFTSPAHHLAAKQPRQRSLSPQEQLCGNGSRRNSQHSRSRSATPGHSPFSSRRKSRQSSLFSHDALQEFTRLYTSPYIPPFSKQGDKVEDTRQETDGVQETPPRSSSNQSGSDSVFIHSGGGSPETSAITNSNTTTATTNAAAVQTTNSRRSTNDLLLKEPTLDSKQYYHLTPLQSNTNSYPCSGTLV